MRTELNEIYDVYICSSYVYNTFVWSADNYFYDALYSIEIKKCNQVHGIIVLHIPLLMFMELDMERCVAFSKSG